VLKRPPAFIEQVKSEPSWKRRLAAAHTVPREMRIEQLYRFEPERFEGILIPTLVLEGDESAPCVIHHGLSATSPRSIRPPAGPRS
jgi:hypothetical protein